MEATVITCDICTRVKGEKNGWFIAVTDTRDPGSREFNGVAFGHIGDPVDDPLLQVEHLCSRECVRERLSRWIETNR